MTTTVRPAISCRAAATFAPEENPAKMPLLDRLIDGSVTDFIKFPHWPAFNVADISITIGVITLLIVIELSGRSERR